MHAEGSSEDSKPDKSAHVLDKSSGRNVNSAKQSPEESVLDSIVISCPAAIQRPSPGNSMESLILAIGLLS